MIFSVLGTKQCTLEDFDYLFVVVHSIGWLGATLSMRKYAGGED
jgi:hypothetical protein